MTALVLIPCESGRPVNGALAALQAAQTLAPLVVLACGEGAQTAANELAAIANVERVLVLDMTELPRAEAAAPFIIEQRSKLDCSHIVAAQNAWARNVLPRVAALLDVMAISDVVRIVDANTYVRPVHAGSALMTLQMRDAVQVLSVRSSAYEAPPSGTSTAAIEAVSPPAAVQPSSVVLERTLPDESDAVELIGARVIVSGGRGTGSAEGFAKIRPLARALGAAVGASRAAVDAGFAPADSQVGQTGKSVAPDLYIALGISGAVQHWAGMKDSKVIVAINKDAEAPIFQFADYGLVADLFAVLPELESSLVASK